MFLHISVLCLAVMGNTEAPVNRQRSKSRRGADRRFHTDRTWSKLCWICFSLCCQSISGDRLARQRLGTPPELNLVTVCCVPSCFGPIYSQIVMIAMFARCLLLRVVTADFAQFSSGTPKETYNNIRYINCFCSLHTNNIFLHLMTTSVTQYSSSPCIPQTFLILLEYNVR